MFKKIISKKYYFYCLLVSFLVLMFTSKCSFLYKFNDWVDANAFFTVGKSMFNGVVPYKDLFEQKGPLLYLIYGIGYLISHKTFLGVFILEIISFSIFLYYAHKIFNMFLNKKYSLIMLPILGFLITTAPSFVHGGSCEELCLPLFSISIYYYIKHFKIEKLTNKEIFINGLMAGLILLMKYTSLGLWMGFGLFILIDYLKEKEFKNGIKFCLIFIGGMLLPFVLFLIYFLINHGVKEFIECYFTFNMTLYNNDQAVSILDNITKIPEGFGGKLYINGLITMILSLMITISVIPLKVDRNKIYFKLSLIGLYVFSGYTLFWGLKFYKYYILPQFSFLIISLLGITILLSKILDKFINKKIMYFIFIIILGLFTYLSYDNANYKNMLKMKRKDFFQFKYADYINKYKNPTLLNMGFLDGGLYTTTGIIPNTRFFEVQNISYKLFPDNLDEMRKNVENKKVKFVLFYSQMRIDEVESRYGYIYDNYDLIFDDTHYFENSVTINAFLFKLKGLEK